MLQKEVLVAAGLRPTLTTPLCRPNKVINTPPDFWAYGVQGLEVAVDGSINELGLTYMGATVA